LVGIPSSFWLDPSLQAARSGPSVPTPRRPGSQPPNPEATTLSNRPVYHGTGALAFSTKGEYGVRLMVQLARRAGQGPASLADIAADEDLPRAYLEQLVMSLRDAGLVRSTRGARGGYELTRDAREIRMSEVLRALEGPIAPMVCASEDPEHGTLCDRSARCTVNVLWVRVRDAVTGALDSMTLADLVPAPLTNPGPSPTTLTGALPAS
jgi:Rrf2 family protein